MRKADRREKTWTGIQHSKAWRDQLWTILEWKHGSVYKREENIWIKNKSKDESRIKRWIHWSCKKAVLEKKRRNVNNSFQDSWNW